ncbi:MAG: DUF362 domain-containing protein [Planctomycetota bacterium]
MSRSVVVLARCASYEIEEVRAAVRRVWQTIPGTQGLASRGGRVFVKINHLGRHPREAAIATDPAVAAAVAEILMEGGARVTVGDGLEVPGEAPYRLSGYEEYAKRFGFGLVNLKGTDYVKVPNPAGGTFASFHVSREVLDADAVVNVPKLKTHMLTLFTGAIKNAYGYLPLGLRRQLHREFPVPGEFARAIVGIYLTRAPAVSIMDGIVALAGDGPSRGGRPHRLGVVMGSTDAAAMDATACRIIGLPPEGVPTLTHACALGAGVTGEDEIDVVGERLCDLRDEEFALPRTSVFLSAMDGLPRPAARLLERALAQTRQWPIVRGWACIGCGLCQRHCPRGAIELRRGIAAINYAACISCFCCQEFCESDAIAVRPNAAVEFAGQALHALKAAKKGIAAGIQRILRKG